MKSGHHLPWALVFLMLLAFRVPAATLYVSLNSTNPVPPYVDWSTAAMNIQDAVDASTNGDLILVTNGIYQTGGRPVNGYALTNRVAIDKAVRVQSVNGPAVTMIQGYQAPAITNGPDAVRCVYLTNSAALIGFTLTNGATLNTGDIFREQSGGGVWCEPSYQLGGTLDEIISNCVLSANSASQCGGGAFSGTLVNSKLIGNTATYGGGAYSTHGGGGPSYFNAVLDNCLLAHNSAAYGGAAAVSMSLLILNNCTVCDNTASIQGGGLFTGIDYAAPYVWVTNCIVFGNTAPVGSNYYYFLGSTGWRIDFCCITPIPTNGVGNFTNNPLFVNPAIDDFHLQADSPCINAGSSNAVESADLDGNPRTVGDFVDIGAYEYPYPAPVPVIPSIYAASTDVSTGFTISFTGQIGGHATASFWDFGDGTVISNQLTNVSHSWTALGDYVVSLWAYNDSHPDGVRATTTIHVISTHYVSLDSTNPVAPYSNWSTAATKIQDAVEASANGDLVLVSNGVYTTGGRTGPIPGQLNRVMLYKPITVQSLNGPGVTVIQGFWDTETNGPLAVRCAWLTNGAVLSGFTLRGGATLTNNAYSEAQFGGGVYSSSSGVVTNCIVTGNAAYSQGGGGYGGNYYGCVISSNYVFYGDGGGNSHGVLTNCTVVGNRAFYAGGGLFNGSATGCVFIANDARNGGGVWSSTALNCLISGNSALSTGGGAGWSTLFNCIVTNNSAFSGGGIFSTNNYLYLTTAYNCLVISNTAFVYGGGACRASLNNCTVIGNSALGSGGGVALGYYYNNCIIYYNTARYDSNWNSGTSLANCCTTPALYGAGNITNEPAFVDAAGGDFCLQPGSPCINAGNNGYVTSSTDLDGNPRIVGGTVDMGAYEYQTPVSQISYAWLQQYGLAITTNSDTADPDNDSMNNYQEWLAGTDPTNPLSLLEILNPIPTNNPMGLLLSWQSVSNRTYFLQSSTNLAAQPAFSTVQSNIVGQPDLTSYMDTNAVGTGPFFYRVGVQE